MTAARVKAGITDEELTGRIVGRYLLEDTGPRSTYTRSSADLPQPDREPMEETL
jgi:hypothetical protein